MTHSHKHAHQAEPHGGTCAHHVKPARYDGIFRLAIALNLSFVLAEFGAGWWANSTALLADAGHNLSDVLGLLIAWFAHALARKPASARYSYGLRSSSILAALLNAMVLIFACGGIVWEALRRIQQPVEVMTQTVMLVAAVGIVINGFSAWLFMRDQQHDLNMRGAYFHMLADALVSLGVVAAGGLIWWTKWNWLDPLITLIIVAIILWGTWSLFKESLAMSLHAVPAHLNLAEVAAYLSAQTGVSQVNDLHIWALSTSETALTADVLVDANADPEILTQLRQELGLRFKIQHVTLQWVDKINADCQLSIPEPRHGHAHDH